MTIILGVNAYHADSSACLIVDGDLVAAAEEERFTRIKHWAGLPTEAVRYCLREIGARFSDIDIIALNSDPGANAWRRVAYAAWRRPSWRLIGDRMRSRKIRRTVADALAQAIGTGEFRGDVKYVEHHLAHLASAFFTSPFDKAGLLSIDGFGDFTSTVWGAGEGRNMRPLGAVHFPHSMGIFYETMTHFLGFRRYGEEYKVMGLAPYGEDRFRREMERIIIPRRDGSFRLALEFFNHHEGRVAVKWENCEPSAGDYYSPQLVELLGPPRKQGDPLTQRHKDVARSAQAAYERVLFRLLCSLHGRCDSDAVVLSGGCAFNSVANGKIYESTPFERAYIQAAAGDAGGALGAALHAWHVARDEPRTFEMRHASWGPGFTEAQVLEALKGRRVELLDAACTWHRLESCELFGNVARALAEGKIIGWFRGRMEWGPRALGNRSILADPRRHDMRDTLNQKIKRRESFRPFAPSVLREHVSDWFETDDDVPFMMKVFRVRAGKRGAIPAVVHVDGTSRLQTVAREDCPEFWRLIQRFYRITGVPMLLNTSFNENEPIVHTPDEALDCFLRTNMDGLVLGNHLVVRRGPEVPVRRLFRHEQSDLENVDD